MWVAACIFSAAPIKNRINHPLPSSLETLVAPLGPSWSSRFSGAGSEIGTRKGCAGLGS